MKVFRAASAFQLPFVLTNQLLNSIELQRCQRMRSGVTHGGGQCVGQPKQCRATQGKSWTCERGGCLQIVQQGALALVRDLPHHCNAIEHISMRTA
eukprot:5820651-Amphidinium_carterae.2